MKNTNVRYSYGGDEHLFVEVSDTMSMDAFFQAMAMSRALEQEAVLGLYDICLTNASFLVRFNPDIISPNDLMSKLQALESSFLSNKKIATRIVEIPVYYNDPWTKETGLRFRDRHQDPSSTDIDYITRINKCEDTDRFIEKHSEAPWLVTMVGFAAGLPNMFQMVSEHEQIQAPKYLSPRTDTPLQSIGHGGCFTCIYSARGFGGYQIFGVTPAPIFDPQQRLDYLADSMVFFRAGDIVKFTPISEREYEEGISKVLDRTFTLKIRSVTFDLEAFTADEQKTRDHLLEALHD